MKKAFCFILALALLAGASPVGFADASAPEPAPTPYSPKNGEIVIAPDYEGACRIKVIADEETDYYVYLEYLGESESSVSERELKEDAEPPYESDLAFYVKAGRWVQKKVPDGVYKLYYATGTDFFGREELFGDETECCSADELLEFYTDENHYAIMYTIEFYRYSDKDRRTAIPREDFPVGSKDP